MADTAQSNLADRQRRRQISLTPFSSATVINNYLALAFRLPNNNIGAAIATDEYVPTMIPISIAKVNPLSPAPPQIYIIRTTRNVVNDVSSVRDNV